jgi:hypothetical protein
MERRTDVRSALSSWDNLFAYAMRDHDGRSREEVSDEVIRVDTQPYALEFPTKTQLFR